MAFFGEDYSFRSADDVLFTSELLLPHFCSQVTTHNAVPQDVFQVKEGETIYPGRTGHF